MITNETVIDVLREMVPEFPVKEYEDLESFNILVFFNIYLKEKLVDNDQWVIDKAVLFVNRMVEEGDETLLAYWDETALSLFDAGRDMYSGFVLNLNKKVRDQFDHSARYWMRQYGLPVPGQPYAVPKKDDWDLFNILIPAFDVPRFAGYDPAHIFDYLTLYVIEKLVSNNIVLIHHCVLFINQVALEGDRDQQALLHKISIGIYDHNKDMYAWFTGMLHNDAKALFDQAIQQRLAS